MKIIQTHEAIIQIHKIIIHKHEDHTETYQNNLHIKHNNRTSYNKTSKPQQNTFANHTHAYESYTTHKTIIQAHKTIIQTHKNIIHIHLIFTQNRWTSHAHNKLIDKQKSYTHIWQSCTNACTSYKNTKIIHKSNSKSYTTFENHTQTLKSYKKICNSYTHKKTIQTQCNHTDTRQSYKHISKSYKHISKSYTKYIYIYEHHNKQIGKPFTRMSIIHKHMKIYQTHEHHTNTWQWYKHKTTPNS